MGELRYKKNSVKSLLEKNDLSDQELNQLKDEYLCNQYFRIKMDRYFIRVPSMKENQENQP